MQLRHGFDNQLCPKNGVSLNVCSRCHPFYTAKQKTIDSGGRVELHGKRFGSTTKTMEVGGS